MEALDEGVLSSLLECASKNSGNFTHALVCRRWRDLSSSTQAAVKIRRQARLAPVDLLAQLAAFPRLTCVHLQHQSVLGSPSAVLGAIAAAHPSRLWSFHLTSPISGDEAREALALLSVHPNVQSLILPNLSGPYSLPDPLPPGNSLTCLELNSWAWASRGDPGSSSPQDKAPVTSLTFLHRWMFLREASNLASLPSDLDGLLSLRTLHLRSLDINALPVAFTRLTLLQDLSLEFPELQCLPAGFGVFSNLSTFLLFSHQLTSLPSSFPCLPRLTRMLLDCPRLVSIPSDMHRLSALHTLELCEFSGPRAPLCTIPSLARLAVDTSVVNFVQDGFGSLVSITDLDIFHFTNDRFPEPICHLPNLRKLACVGGSNCVSSLPQSLGNLKNLHVLRVESVHMGMLPRSFTDLLLLSHLTIKGCPRLQCLPESFGNLSSLQSVVLLDLRVLAALPLSVSQLALLRELTLDALPCIREIPRSFDSLTSLTQVRVTRCPRLKQAPPRFKKLMLR